MKSFFQLLSYSAGIAAFDELIKGANSWFQNSFIASAKPELLKASCLIGLPAKVCSDCLLILSVQKNPISRDGKVSIERWWGESG
jgi:hypothetical protein